MTTNQADNRSIKTEYLITAMIVAVCLVIYGQVLWFQFINFDDNLYVYENPFVTSGLTAVSMKWAFTAFHSANWHPLTWLSHMLDATLFGPNAGGHHFVNVIFHTANSVLAFVVFRRLTGDVWKSAVVAFLFAVHPAHVESVAWVSERKDVLSSLFWLLTMLAYVQYAKGPANHDSFLRRALSLPFLLTVVFFALGLMSKPMLVTLPFVLLLCDYWPLARLRASKDLVPLIVEKLPMFLLAGISAYITIQAQAAYGALQSSAVLPLDARFQNALVSYSKYIVMLFYPVNLGVGYAYKLPFPLWQIVGSALLVVSITVFCIWQAQRRKYLLFGWLWFLGTLVPVIGLVQVGAQSMADRYTYIPYFGLFVIIVWGVAEFLPRFGLNFSSTAVAAAIPIAALSVFAFNQTSVWKDSVTLYMHTLGSGQGNFITMNNLCSALAVRDRLAEAEPHCRNSIAAEPVFADSHILLGVINTRFGKTEEAIANLRRALEIDPNNAMALVNIATPLAMSGNTNEASQSLNTALDIYRRQGTDPRGLANSFSNLAAIFAKQNRFDKAAESLETLLEFAPDRSDARANYALALFLQNKLAEAKVEVDRAIAQNPNQAEGYNILGKILEKQGDNSRAAAQFERALQIKPDLKEAKDNLERMRPKNVGR